MEPLNDKDPKRWRKRVDQRSRVRCPSRITRGRTALRPCANLAFFRHGFMVAALQDPGNWRPTSRPGPFQLSAAESGADFEPAGVVRRGALKLGIATGRGPGPVVPRRVQAQNLARALCVVRIPFAATDLAVVLGSAIALNLLFHIPMALGVCITAADVLVVLLLQTTRASARSRRSWSRSSAPCGLLRLELYTPRRRGVGSRRDRSVGRNRPDRAPLYAIASSGDGHADNTVCTPRSSRRAITRTGPKAGRGVPTRRSTRSGAQLAFFINAAICHGRGDVPSRRPPRHREIATPTKMLSPCWGAAASALFGLRCWRRARTDPDRHAGRPVRDGGF
jgi:hypothetical protein